MKKFFLVLLVNGLFLSVLAEGYQVNVLSTKQTGMGHVGSGMKLGAESMHFNPAGLVYLREHVDISLGVAGIFSNAKYQQGGYTGENG